MDRKEEIQQLKQLVTVIEESEKTQEVIQWLREICSENDQQKLIESLIESFMQNLVDVEYSNSILRALRKLNDWIPEEVLPQMKTSLNFPFAISEYLTKIQIKQMVGDGFILLTQIFKASNFKKVTNGMVIKIIVEKFIGVLFDSFEFIEDEEIFKAVVAILVKISNEEADTSKNQIIRICQNHPNQRYFSETLIHLLNKSAFQDELEVGLKFVEQILKVNPEFFYGNDFKVLLDLAIRMIQDEEGQCRYLYLKTVQSMCQTPNFKKTMGSGRVNDVTELMFNVVSDCEDFNCKIAAQEVLDSLQR